MSYGMSLHVKSRRVDPLRVAGQQLNYAPAIRGGPPDCTQRDRLWPC